MEPVPFKKRRDAREQLSTDDSVLGCSSSLVERNDVSLTVVTCAVFSSVPMILSTSYTVRLVIRFPLLTIADLKMWERHQRKERA